MEDALEHRHLVVVQGRPVVVEDAAGVPAVRVQAPIRETQAVLFDVVDQIVLPDAFLRGGVTLVSAELANPDGGDTSQAQKGPVLVPNTVEVSGETWIVEPSLVVDSWSVVVRRVDHLVTDAEADRSVTGIGDVSAPPVIVATDGFDSLDNEQPLGYNAEELVGHPLSRLIPVSAGAGGPPSRLPMGLIMEISSNDSVLIFVPLSQELPVADPLTLWDLASVPQLALAVLVGSVSVEYDPKSDFLAPVNQIVEDFERLLAL